MELENEKAVGLAYALQMGMCQVGDKGNPVTAVASLPGEPGRKHKAVLKPLWKGRTAWNIVQLLTAHQ